MTFSGSHETGHLLSVTNKIRLESREIKQRKSIHLNVIVFGPCPFLTGYDFSGERVGLLLTMEKCKPSLL